MKTKGKIRDPKLNPRPLSAILSGLLAGDKGIGAGHPPITAAILQLTVNIRIIVA
jgi:hypothetical protein